MLVIRLLLLGHSISRTVAQPYRGQPAGARNAILMIHRSTAACAQPSCRLTRDLRALLSTHCGHWGEGALRSMLRLLGMAAVSLSFWSAVASTRPGGAPASASASIRIRVDVTSAAEDRMARRLASTVVNALMSDSRFTLVERGSPHALNISLPARVGWQRRLDWTEISYQARLSLENTHSRVVAGRCWNWNLKVCAKQIADAAAQFGN